MLRYLSIFALILSTSAGALAKAPVFEDRDGVIVFEVESARPEGGEWGGETELEGFTGKGYYTWRGKDLFNTPGKGTLAYPIVVHKGGTYKLRIHNRHDFEDRTEQNDCWTKLDDGKWIKTFSSRRGRWTWHTHHEHGHDHKAAASYELTPGKHVFYISGRSRGFSIDRVHLIHEDVEDGTDTALAETRVDGREPKVAKKPATDKSSAEGVKDVRVLGLRKVWHCVTLDFTGPETSEQAATNPFSDYRLDVTFTQGDRTYVVPGFYAADGRAADTSAEAGSIWRAHFRAPSAGVWQYRASFRKGEDVAIADDPQAGEPAAFDGASGEFEVTASDATGRDLRAHGLLEYVDRHHLRFAGSGEWWLKAGADSPENFLGYADFDQTEDTKLDRRGRFLHRYEPHEQDFRPDDPTWGDGRGKGIIGAINYLASVGVNSIYFLPYNIDGGDGGDTWPWISTEVRDRFDCSKLAQWEIVFTHMERNGIAMHVVTQEQENDQALDGGELGRTRKLYYRELIARFGHHLAIEWNLGEENTNTPEQRKAFARYIRGLDPWDHPIVCHTFPDKHEQIYPELLGFEAFEGPSLQMDNKTATHRETIRWIKRSDEAGRPWFVCLDEIGPAGQGVKPDAKDPDHDAVRHKALWGNLMAGGSGCEWYFGYDYANNDLTCEDFRSRENMWKQTALAVGFFQEHLPFHEMRHGDELVRGEAWCLAKPNAVYAVYLPKAAEVALNVGAGHYSVMWFNPRKGGELQTGSVAAITGPGSQALGTPPDAKGDWVALIRKAQ